MNEILIPASYDVWLTDLKLYLDRTPGSKAALARYLVAVRGIKLPSARVKVSELLSQRYMPAADLFLDIAGWLQQQTGGRLEPVHLQATDDLPPRREIIYATGSKQRATQVAEES